MASQKKIRTTALLTLTLILNGAARSEEATDGLQPSSILKLVILCAQTGGCGNAAPPTEPPPAATPEAGGFYFVDFLFVDGTPGDAILAVTEDGRFWASEDPTGPIDGLYIRGSLTQNGDEFTGSGRQFAPPGYVFVLDNGQQSTYLDVNIFNGRINESRQDLEGQTTVDGLSGIGAFRALASAEQRALYDRTSSTAALAGHYRDVRTGTSIDVTIASNGSINGGMLGSSSCSITGTSAPVGTDFNLYDLQVSVGGCPGLIGGNYSGVGVLQEDSFGDPILVTAGDNNIDALFVYILDRL